MGDRILTTLGEGDLVWVPASEASKEVYTKAKILAVDEAGATARTEDDEKRLVQLDFEEKMPWQVNPESAQTSSDVCGLFYLHEAGILQNLQERSYIDEPYTNMGSVMIAVNPLRKIADPPGMMGSKQAALMGKPHPYAIAEIAFQQMVFNGSREAFNAGGLTKVDETKAHQSVVISGESGAGKTESAKMSLAHLVQRGGSGGDLDSRLLGTNPILEAFGNAQTLRNPNSSRFGKLLQLHFRATDKLGREYALIAASVETYLLERSRIVFHAEGERNYHLFYMMVAGADSSLKSNMGLLSGAKDFRYLTPSHDTAEGGLLEDWQGLDNEQVEKDKQLWEEMLEALDQVGITGQDRKELWAMCSAILHIGNIVFVDEETAEGEQASVKEGKSQDSLNKAAELLGVNATSFEKIFTERQIKSVGETIIAKRNARAASFARDAVAKTTYARLFDWLIGKIDVALQVGDKPTKRDPKIGVLDIFGFESFQFNGFEQLLINYANEALQATFNRQVFIAEAALYEKEGLFGSGEYFGRPMDNSVCLELLQGPGPNQTPDPKTNPKGGLLMIIDSEGSVPDAKDEKLNKRLHQTYFKNPAFVRTHPKDAATKFQVRHYAGVVTYTVGTFLEKNNDQLPGEMEQVFTGSSSALVVEMFPKAVEDQSKKRKKPPARSIVRKFKTQILDLIDTLESTRCSFIRCVKPNASMKRNESRTWFDRDYVTRQLHALNIPQTAEVLRNGFPTRIEYSSLVDSYKDALPKDALLFFNKGGGTDHVGFVRALFYAFEVTPDTYKLGLTRVFFRSGQLAALDSILRQAADGVSDEIASRFKKFYVRNIWRRGIAKAKAVNRFLKSLHKIQKRTESAVKIQAVVRGIGPRRKLKRTKRGALYAQARWRGIKARKEVGMRRQELLEAAKKRAAEAKERASQAAEEERERLRQEAEEAEKAQKEAEERAEEQRKRAEEEDKKKQQAADDAIKHYEEQEKAEEEKQRKKRKQSVMPVGQASSLGQGSTLGVGGDNLNAPRSTRAMRRKDGRVQLASRGRKLRQKSIAPQLQREMDRKARLKGLRERIHGTEEKSAAEKLATVEKENFHKPVFGWMYVKLAKKPLLGPAWVKRYVVLEKPSRILRTYKREDRRKPKEDFQLAATTKIGDGEGEVPKKKNVIKVEDHKLGVFHLVCPTSIEKDTWIRDLREAVTGFMPTASTLKQRSGGTNAHGATGPLGAIAEGDDDDEEGEDVPPPPPDDEETEEQREFREMYAAQLRREKISQLQRLLDIGSITKNEFNDMCSQLAHSFDDGSGKTMSNKMGSNTATKQYDEYPENELNEEEEKQYLAFLFGVAGPDAEPLKNPAMHTPYQSGVLSMEMVGHEKEMDYATYEEYVVFKVECRYKTGNGRIGWSVGRRFKQWRAFAMTLTGQGDAISPLDEHSLSQLPPFPKKGKFDNIRGVKSAQVVTERSHQLKKWFDALCALAPQTSEEEEEEDEAPGESDSDEDEEEAPDVPDKPDQYLGEKWEKVVDHETGEEYYYNTETGLTTWERPRADSAPPPVPPKPPLLPGWEAIKDEESGEIFYWHAVTQTSSWERPMATNASKVYDLSQLFHIPVVTKFFEIKKNVRKQRQAAAAL